MKTPIFLLCTLFLLTACTEQKQAAPSTAETQQTTQSTTTSTQEGETMKTHFTGKIVEEIEGNSADQTVRIFLKELEAISDPETILPNFQEGVILHVPEEKMPDAKKGSTVDVVLQGIPIMTMSIPPQIPGNSIEQVTIRQ